MPQHSTVYHEVRREHHCPVCERRSGCMLGEDNSIMCLGAQGPVAGFRCFGGAKKDPSFTIYRRESDPSLRPLNPGGESPSRQERAEKKSPKREPKVSWVEQARIAAAALTEGKRFELARYLGLPLFSLDGLAQVGFRQHRALGSTWTFPVIGADGQVCGLLRRSAGGQKGIEEGGNGGVLLGAGWEEAAGDLYLPEGPSDCLALYALGLAAMGRPSKMGGIDVLASQLHDFASHRKIIVLAERDLDEATLRWPGREGALATAQRLADGLGRAVYWALPPSEKDVRAWVVARKIPSEDPEHWQLHGQEFVASLKLHTVEPASKAKDDTSPGLLVDWFDQLIPEVTEFTVPGYFPEGELILIAGDGKVGKSMLVADLASCFSRGLPCLGLAYPPPQEGTILIANCEDNARRTTMARLFAAGANMAKVGQIRGIRDDKGKERPFSLAHLEEIEAVMKKRGDVKLVIVDPVASYVAAAGVDDNNDGEVRSVLNPFGDLMTRSNCLGVLIKHLNKGSATKAASRIAGTAGYRNRCRAVYFVFKDKQVKKRRLFLCDGVNGFAEPSGLVYQLLTGDESTLQRVRSLLPQDWTEEKIQQFAPSLASIIWTGETEETPDSFCEEAQAVEPDFGPDIARASIWLKRFLQAGPQLADGCVEEGNAAENLNRDRKWWRDKILKRHLQGESEKEMGKRHGRYYFCLPGQKPPEAEPEAAE